MKQLLKIYLEEKEKIMFDAVIFDLDGVICFTDKYHYLAWKKLADQEGIEFDEHINNRLRGVSRLESLKIVLEKSNKKYSNEDLDKLQKQKNESYVESLDKLSASDVTEEVLNVLNTLKEKGILLAIGSSSKNAKTILNKLELTSYFEVIVDGNQITNSKPDPEVFLKAQNELGIAIEKCLVVEDAKSGIDAAISGGFLCAGLEEASRYSKTTYKIENIMEIIEIVLDGGMQ